MDPSRHNVVVDSLQVRAGRNTIVNNVSFEIQSGEVLALLGPNGEGKSTIGLSLTGGIPDMEATRMFASWGADERRVTHGDLVIADKRINLLHPSERGIGYVPQQNSLFPSLTAEENVGVALQSVKNKDDRIKRIRFVLSLLDLTERSRMLPRKLSGGQGQRVAIARAIANDPQLLILDEAFSNQDSRRYEFMSAIRSQVKENSSSALFITHMLSDAMRFSDRVAILHKGVIQQIGTPSAVFRNPKTRFVAEYFSQIQTFLSVDLVANFLGTQYVESLPRGTRTVGIHSNNVIISPNGSGMINGKVVDAYEDLQNKFARVYVSDGDLYFTGITTDYVTLGQPVSLSFQKRDIICFDSHEESIEY